MRLVAVPADANPNVVFGTENPLDPGRMASECFDGPNNLRQRGRKVWPAPMWQVIVVAESERSNAPLAFEFAELEGLKREGADRQNKLYFDRSLTRRSRRRSAALQAPGSSSNRANSSDTKPCTRGCRVCRLPRRRCRSYTRYDLGQECLMGRE